MHQLEADRRAEVSERSREARKCKSIAKRRKQEEGELGVLANKLRKEHQQMHDREKVVFRKEVAAASCMQEQENVRQRMVVLREVSKDFNHEMFGNSKELEVQPSTVTIDWIAWNASSKHACLCLPIWKSIENDSGLYYDIIVLHTQPLFIQNLIWGSRQCICKFSQESKKRFKLTDACLRVCHCIYCICNEVYWDRLTRSYRSERWGARFNAMMM